MELEELRSLILGEVEIMSALNRAEKVKKAEADKASAEASVRRRIAEEEGERASEGWGWRVGAATAVGGSGRAGFVRAAACYPEH